MTKGSAIVQTQPLPATLGDTGWMVQNEARLAVSRANVKGMVGRSRDEGLGKSKEREHLEGMIAHAPREPICKPSELLLLLGLKQTTCTAVLSPQSKPRSSTTLEVGGNKAR